MARLLTELYARGMEEALSLAELGAVYERQDSEGRDELLQCLLIAVSNGWECVQDLLDPLAFEAYTLKALDEL